MTLWFCTTHLSPMTITKFRPLIFSSQFWAPCLHAATKCLERPFGTAQLPVQVFHMRSFKLSVPPKVHIKS